MLRFDHLPSDFHPLFLFLGESEDLTALAGLLRTFAEGRRSLNVGEQLPAARSKAKLTIVPEEGSTGNYGLKPDGPGSFRWGLNAWQAEEIARRIELLAAANNKSGSEIIELGAEDEIPVKISLGEFTDDFLVRRF
ncbi:hypothetical protein [Bradyrhizobium sp. sBnM-33]|uniref:hypothetical protein n=1 Tax=Bradyrhizobium sp. sBnM-33 TaxID=2831780 RepID=UPI001BCB2349|nr:hypothetical protein [Bradyrhizobium sp. sBnM-33]WOH48407.1 hypothetical protein RX328_30400 [Bradyrhizobium sp. sBnM-33]